MKTSENALNLLAARTFKGVGPKWINMNLIGAQTDAEIVRRLADKVEGVCAQRFRDAKESVARKIRALEGFVDGVVGAGDAGFPPIPPDVKAADRPIALFYKGDIGLLDRPERNVALVGVLNPDAAVVADEERVAGRLVREGYCIVSGLALGCDTVGHRCALEGRGKTVAFLAGPLNEINPAANRLLADEIVAKGGLLVSEYYDTPRSRQAFLGRYVERDRLQAMFVRCVVLAASYDENNLGRDCGSRFALGKAKEYGVPRAAIYTPRAEGNPIYDLNRAILADGACAQDPDDASAELPPPPARLPRQDEFLI